MRQIEPAVIDDAMLREAVRAQVILVLQFFLQNEQNSKNMSGTTGRGRPNCRQRRHTIRQSKTFEAWFGIDFENWKSLAVRLTNKTTNGLKYDRKNNRSSYASQSKMAGFVLQQVNFVLKLGNICLVAYQWSRALKTWPNYEIYHCRTIESSASKAWTIRNSYRLYQLHIIN